MSGSPGSAAPRALRVALVIAGSVIALIALVLAGIWALGNNLSHPAVKTRVQAALRDRGLTVDYEGLEISPMRGLHARSLRILQPPKFRSVAEEFVRIDDLDLQLSAIAWAFGARTLEVAQIGGLEATVVRDAAGATTLSELFPPAAPAADTEPDPPSKLSQSLAGLPELTIARLALERVRANLLDLREGGKQHEITVSGLGLRGTVRSAPNDLRGTDLQLTAAPLRVDVRDDDQLQFAEAKLDVHARGEPDTALRLQARADLIEQTLWPAWQQVSELLRLDSRVQLAPAAGRTDIAVSELRALGTMLTARAAIQVHDAAVLRMSADAKADLDVPQLPIPVPGLSLSQLRLALDAKRLSWEGDRVSGSLSWSGGLAGFGWEQADQRAELGQTQLSGKGEFDGPSGHFAASVLAAAGSFGAAQGTGRLTQLALELSGKTVQQTGGQQVNADATVELGAAELATPAREQVQLRETKLHATVAGTAAELATRLVPALEAQLELGHVDAVSGEQRLVAEQLSAAFKGQQVTPDDTSPSGVRGQGQLTLSAPSLRVYEGRVSAEPARAKPGARKSAPPARRAALALDDLQLQASAPLALAQAGGAVSFASLTAADAAIKGLQLDFELQKPLEWSADRAGPARAQLSGKIGALRSATDRGSVDELRLLAEKLDKQRYRINLTAGAGGLVTQGQVVPGKLSTELHADTTPNLGKLALTAAVRGMRGASLDLKLDTSVAGRDRLKYQAELKAEKLDAFAALIYGFAPDAKAVKVEGARLHASAHGDLTGVLRLRPGAPPEPTPSPLTSARGDQALEVTLSGLDYRGPDRVIVIPDLHLTLDSTHGDAGAGSARAVLKASQIQYDAEGTSLQLGALDQRIDAKFDHAPSEGVVDVRTHVELGSAAQSFFPVYRVAGLRFDAHAEVDHLRSIFLRELSLSNPAAGTELAAKGALELRTRSSEDGKTLVGREALALEGGLTQALAPFQKLGFASHASGKLKVPFRLESGGLLGYRLFAALEAEHVTIVSRDKALAVEDLNGVIPVVEEFALLPGGGAPVVSAGPRSSPLSEARFFDVHPFLKGTDYVTAKSITLRGLSPLGPLAANVRLERSDFLIDQLQVGFNAGQIVGQVRVSYRDGDPIVRMRLNGTGLRTSGSNDVFDANAALSFVPNAMTLEGKVQIVRVSRSHLLGILDVVDPFHESASANRIRQGLNFGYPKFVRFQLHDGALDTKVELGGMAKLVRIDEIKAVPLGPILQRYVAPALAEYLRPAEPEQQEPPK